MLETEAVKAVLSETNLPEPAQTRLAEAEYETKEALETVIDRERKYLAEVSDIGKPKDMNTKPVVKSEKPIAERETNVLKKYGIGR